MKTDDRRASPSEVQAQLGEVSRRLAAADALSVGELLAARRELLDLLEGRSELDADMLLSSAREAEDARLPLIAQRETLRAQITELRRTRAGLRSLPGHGSGAGGRLDLRG